MLGLSDMGMPDQLYHYMVGGQKRPLVSLNLSNLKRSLSRILPLFSRFWRRYDWFIKRLNVKVERNNKTWTSFYRRNKTSVNCFDSYGLTVGLKFCHCIYTILNTDLLLRHVHVL